MLTAISVIHVVTTNVKCAHICVHMCVNVTSDFQISYVVCTCMLWKSYVSWGFFFSVVQVKK